MIKVITQSVPTGADPDIGHRGGGGEFWSIFRIKATTMCTQKTPKNGARRRPSAFGVINVDVT